MPAIRILLLDNRDSFVWNLAQALGSLGAEVEVLRSDATDLDRVRAGRYDALVLSPGPGRPEHAGISVAAVKELSGTLPILGVCLGHQAIGTAFGGTIRREAPVHGKAWAIHHEACGLYESLPSPLTACRYHSLVIDPATLPDDLVADAWTEDRRVLMGVRHRREPTFGVQFHPESFLSPHGPPLLAAFLEQVA